MMRAILIGAGGLRSLAAVLRDESFVCGKKYAPNIGSLLDPGCKGLQPSRSITWIQPYRSRLGFPNLPFLRDWPPSSPSAILFFETKGRIVVNIVTVDKDAVDRLLFVLIGFARFDILIGLFDCHFRELYHRLKHGRLNFVGLD